MKSVLITGVAGFIGSNIADFLLSNNFLVHGVDNFDTYYNRSIKENNLVSALKHDCFTFHEMDILDSLSLNSLLMSIKPDYVIHLAAKAGVRPSILHPQDYFTVNVIGTLNLLEAMRLSNVKKMLFASSSSVYGNDKIVPFVENNNVDHPVSPYAASKRAGELLCHTYHHLYQMDIFCLRFFTVYGPRQRPDLAIFKFTRSLFEESVIPFYGDGSSMRDYTHISDILQGIDNALRNLNGYDIFNLGESFTTSLSDLVSQLEVLTNKAAIKEFLPMQDGDVLLTYADISKSKKILGYNPRMNLKEGLSDFVQWYKETYGN